MDTLLQCKQCSGTDLEKITDSRYRCTYCGAVYYHDGENLGPVITKGQKPGIRQRSIAVAVLTMIMLVGACAVYFLLAKKDHLPHVATPGIKETTPAHKSIKFGPETIAQEQQPQGDFTRVAQIHDSLGNVYFMGIYRNTGSVEIRKPMVVVILYSADDHKVASGKGFAIRETLAPGEETPIIVLVKTPPKYTRYEMQNEPKPPYNFSHSQRPDMTFRNVVMKKGQYAGYEVNGEIVNTVQKTVQYISIITLLFDSGEKIIGGAMTYVPETSLKSDDYAPFSIKVTTVKATPRSYILDYTCSVKK